MNQIIYQTTDVTRADTHYIILSEIPPPIPKLRRQLAFSVSDICSRESATNPGINTSYKTNGESITQPTLDPTSYQASRSRDN